MTEENRGVVRIQTGDGSPVTFQNFTARDAFTDPLTRFEFDTAPPRSQFDDYRRRLTKGEICTLKINGATQGSFIIETTRTIISPTGGLKLHVAAVSPLITPYQASVDPDIVNVHSTSDVPVSDVILKAFAPFGFDKIIYNTRANVQSLTGFQIGGKKPDTIERKLKVQDAQAQQGEATYQFAARLLNHLGVCMRMSVSGTLLVGAPDYLQAPCASLVQGRGDGDRFIESIEIEDTNDEQFSEVIARGNRVTNPETNETSRPKAALTAEEAFPNGLSLYKSHAAAYKPKVLLDKHARDPQRCASIAKLVLGLRAARAWVLTGEVDGFVSKNGAVWSVDTVVNVTIDALGFKQPLWVLDREFRLSPNDGSKTRLRCIPLGSLLLGDVPS